MPTFYVTFKIDARYVAEVKDAKDLDEAREKARDMFCEADFGEAEDIGAEEIIVEDEKGNFVWER